MEAFKFMPLSIPWWNLITNWDFMDRWNMFRRVSGPGIKWLFVEGKKARSLPQKVLFTKARENYGAQISFHLAFRYRKS